MNQEYIEFVKSRAKGGDAILLSLTPEKCHLLHMAIGISGEAAEFLESQTDENDREEGGDLLFYITGATFSLPSWSQDDWLIAEDELREDKYKDWGVGEAITIAAGHFLDLVKKYTVYNKPFDEQAIKDALKEVIYQLGTYFEYLPAIANENMTKLLKRYANGYSDKAAQERADKKEGE